MQIRTKLTLQFLLLGGLIILIASIAIYYFSYNFRRNDFHNLLRSRALTIAKLVLDSYEYNTNLFLRAGAGYSTILPNEKFLIINFNGDTLYTSDANWVVDDMNTIIRQVKANKEVFFKQNSYEVLGISHSTGLQKFVLIGAAIDKESLIRMKKLRTSLILVCLASLILFFFAGWFYSRKALKPISEVIRKVEEISITSLNLRVPEGNGTDEIGRLAKTFNRMLERLETSFAMQKNFIANASHELRTPLTSINTQLEVLMMKDRPVEEYKSALDSVHEDIRSMIALSNRLILIARTSAEGPFGYNKKVRMDEIMWQVKEDMNKFNKEYHINIILNDSLTDSDQITVAGDEYLLKVAVSNIIENACKYSSDSKVDVSFGYTGKMVEVIFEDQGIGISKEDQQKIFEPFYRGSNAPSNHGSGIGLSLVNQIIKNHNGTIKISSEIGKGTKVTLKIPVSN